MRSIRLVLVGRRDVDARILPDVLHSAGSIKPPRSDDTIFVPLTERDVHDIAEQWGARCDTLQEWSAGRARQPSFTLCTQVRGVSSQQDSHFRIEFRRRLLARSLAKHLA